MGDILITGATGFIGSYLCKNLPEAKKFSKSLNQDILNPEHLDNALKGVKKVVHLAAAVSEATPYLELYDINVKGTSLLLEKCLQNGVEKFIFLSTAGVYGNIKKEADERTFCRPETPYEKTKHLAEQIALSYKNKLNVIILRSALVYGPNKYWKGILKLIKNRFPIIGDGNNSFQLIYIKDLVDAILFFLQNDVPSGEIFNVAQDEKPTLNEFYILASELLGKKQTPKHINKSLALILAKINKLYCRIAKKESLFLPEYIERLCRNRNYSINKITSLGWKPKYSLKEGLKETIAELGLSQQP